MPYVAPRTFVNRAGITYDAAKTTVIFAEDMNKLKDNDAYLKTEVEKVVSGWNSLGAVTYEGADAPSYTISFASDMTSILSLGMRIKLTDSTVKYFIITKIGAFSGGKTIITLYGGTDYTLSGGAITLCYYSQLKAPFGFPLNPTKWQFSYLLTGAGFTQNTPTQNQWYNAATISIPVGAWKVRGKGFVSAHRSTVGYISCFVALSTTNNGATSDILQAGYFAYISWTTNQTITNAFGMIGDIDVTSKTNYYLNGRTTDASLTDFIFATNGGGWAILFDCAYL